MKKAVHLIYPHQRIASTPHAIGWHLADALAKEHPTYVYDWDMIDRISPGPNDVLIGHPHPLPGTILRRSWFDPKWKRRILLCPYSGDIRWHAFADRFVRTSDVYLSITGRPWAESLAFGPLAHWSEKLIQLDLAVDRRFYPRLRSAFNPRGARRVLYIGNTGTRKAPGYLEAIARLLPNVEFGHIGPGRLAGFVEYGPRRTDLPGTKQIVQGYDFLLVGSTNDANPTVVLEAMSWGLIPVATPTSGYREEDGVISIPTLDPDSAAVILRHWLDDLSDDELLNRQRKNDALLTEKYTWERFIHRVREHVESEDKTEPIECPQERTNLVRFATLSSPWYRQGSMWKSLVRNNGSAWVKNFSQSSARLPELRRWSSDCETLT